MATAKKTTAAPQASVSAGSDPAPAAPPPVANPLPARIQPQQYSEDGWAVGNRVPYDQYMEVGQDGQPFGKPSRTPVPGYGQHVAIKGDVVTHAMRATLGMED